MNKKIRVNVVSESDISVQGHGVHTAYEEMAAALEGRDDVTVIRGEFGRTVDCDIVHLHTLGARTWRKLFQPYAKKVVSAHVVPDSFVGSLILAKYWLFLAKWYMRWFYNHADLVLAVSEEAKSDLRQLGVRAPIKVLYNFIDTAKYQTPTASRSEMRQKLGIPADAFVVIGAGQVQPRKRVDSFFYAAQALPDVHFIWVGGIPFGKVAASNHEMMKMMQSAPANVHFPGIVELKEMVSYYHSADAFWLPSEQETFGLVVVEAASAGLPIILRDIPDYDDTFGDDAVRGDDDVAVATIKKLRSDPRYYERQKAKAAQVAKRFDSTNAAAKLVKLYRQLV